LIGPVSSYAALGPQASNVSDPLSDLVVRAQHGDGAALTQLVETTQQRVYNLAYRILRNRQEAEDLAQDIYVRVWRALPDFRGESKFTTWLHVIATNTCLNRRRKLRKQLESEVDAEDQIDMIPLAEDDADPEGHLERHDQEAVWRAIGDLAPKYSLVLTMFYQQQLSYNEIAETLGLPLGTVKAHLNRARCALARNLSRTRTI
jgi:RNA polymerase sigma-70 factor, ECF subfamily